RFTWQLNTLMKIDTRGNGLSPSPSSAGGSACTTIDTRPSAGDTTMPSRTGVTRTGSRKNNAHQIVSTLPIQPSGGQIQNRPRRASAKPPRKGYPSGWIGGICARMELAIDIEARLQVPRPFGGRSAPYFDYSAAVGKGFSTVTGAESWPASAAGGGRRFG